MDPFFEKFLSNFGSKINIDGLRLNGDGICYLTFNDTPVILKYDVDCLIVLAELCKDLQEEFQVQMSQVVVENSMNQLKKILFAWGLIRNQKHLLLLLK